MNRRADGFEPASGPSPKALAGPADSNREFDWISADGYASFNDADTPAEVDAVFRMQRRIALSHFAVFIIVTLGVGLTLVGLQWAAESQVFGGFSPGFIMAGVGLYLFFVLIGVAAASLANAVEDRMMGARSLPSDTKR